MGIDVSVIIPVYNIQDYVSKAVESVLSQTGITFEIILIDDGSTDNSGRICDAYAQKDTRITVIHKQNQGLGFARNSGLQAMSQKLLKLD